MMSSDKDPNAADHGPNNKVFDWNGSGLSLFDSFHEHQTLYPLHNSPSPSEFYDCDPSKPPQSSTQSHLFCPTGNDLFRKPFSIEELDDICEQSFFDGVIQGTYLDSTKEKSAQSDFTGLCSSETQTSQVSLQATDLPNYHGDTVASAMPEDIQSPMHRQQDPNAVSGLCFIAHEFTNQTPSSFVLKKTKRLKNLSVCERKPPALKWHHISKRDYGKGKVDYFDGMDNESESLSLDTQNTDHEQFSQVGKVDDKGASRKSFVRFCSHIRHHYKRLYPTLSNTEVMKLIAAAWRDLDESQKDIFRRPFNPKDLHFIDLSNDLSTSI